MRGPNNIDWNNEIWDAQRLVREFVSLKAWDYRGKTMEELVWSDQILFQRLIAVIHAYIGDPFHRTGIPFSYTSAVFSQSGYDNLETLQNSPIDKADRKTIQEWLFQWRDQAFQALWREEDFTWSPGERGHMINALLMQRFKVQKCLEVYDGWLVCSRAGFMAVNACKSLYNPFLEQTNEQVDRIIALLLGSSFKGTFTVAELTEKHQYPKATDEEVFDWQIDNY